MENEYVIDLDTNFDDCTYVLISNSHGESEHASFKNEKDAKEYCEWKNQKKIDKDFKQQMLNHFNSLQIKNSNKWMYNQYQILIKQSNLWSANNEKNIFDY